MNDLTARLRDWGARGVRGTGAERARLIGAAVSAAWLMLVLLFWLLGPEGGPQSGLARLVSWMGVLLPLVLVWVAVGLAQAIAALQAEAAALRARVDLMRDAAPGAAEPIPAAPGLAQASAARATARPAPRPAAPGRPATHAAPAEPRQSDLPLDGPQPVEVAPEDLVAALNFPDGPDDTRAIAALRAALADPDTARTIRAAQDVVTLLARHGIYMDDLATPPAPAAIWRRFAAGQRGAAVAALADTADPDATRIVETLMRGDEVFRDAAHHFLRQFDRTQTRAAEAMNDAGVAALAETRSGRAFALLARATGMFG